MPLLARKLGLAAMLLTAASAYGADGACVEPPRGQEREATALKRSGGRAIRLGDLLHLTTAAGPVELQDNSASCDGVGQVDECRRFGLVDWIAEHGWLVVHAGYWEAESYIVVVASTGEQVVLEGYPWLSLDRSRLVTVTGNESGELFNGVDIWRIDGAVPRLEQRLENEPRSSGIEFFCFAGWRDDAQVDLRGARYVDRPPTSSVQVPSTLNRTRQEWRLQVGPR